MKKNRGTNHMVTLDDLNDEDLNNLVLAFQITYRKEIIPQELLSRLSQDALRYYVDEMEKITGGNDS